MDLYDGLMYRQFKPVLKSDKARAFASQHVLIATALYGLIAANAPIAPHRLDFMKSLKVNGKPLKAYWKAQYDTSISANQDEVLVSLLSSEFEQVFSPSLRRLFLRVQFLEEVDGRLKRHSTISKKGRGQLLAYCIEHQVQMSRGTPRLSPAMRKAFFLFPVDSERNFFDRLRSSRELSSLILSDLSTS